MHRRGETPACRPQAGLPRGRASRRASRRAVSPVTPRDPRVVAAASRPEHGHRHHAYLPCGRGREPAEPEGAHPPGHRHPRGRPGAAAGGGAGPDPRQARRTVPLGRQGEPGLPRAPGGHLPIPSWEHEIPRAWEETEVAPRFTCSFQTTGHAFALAAKATLHSSPSARTVSDAPDMCSSVLTAAQNELPS